MAPSYISSVVLLLSYVLPALGITIGSDAIQTTVQTILAIVVPLFVMFRQYVTGRSTLVGKRPAA